MLPEGIDNATLSQAVFFRQDRRLWYVQINGRQTDLGPDQDEAFRRYHDLIRQPEPVASQLVAGIIDGLLDWCQKDPRQNLWVGLLVSMGRGSFGRVRGPKARAG